MHPPRLIRLALLLSGRPGLTTAAAAFLVEAASVCLDREGHGLIEDLSLPWLPGDGHIERMPVGRQAHRSWNDPEEATEYGAAGVALSVVEVARGQVVVERSPKGRGFDYWVGEDDDQLFTGKARLEVSGTRSGPAEANKRMVRKLSRLRKYPSAYPGLAVIVEFSTPLVLLEEV